MKKLICAIMIIAGLPACKAGQNSQVDTSIEPAIISELPSVRTQLSCLPESAAFVAAHRGTSKKENLPENAGSSLKALIERGILFAEIDVAGLRDGTHVLFHDGVWDEKSSGKGAVASDNWGQAQNYLLKETDGDFSADPLIRFEDVLKLAKDKIYLEVDFKSSAKYEYVVDAVRKFGLEDQVILISYSEGQAAKLARLAPEMMLSVSAKSKSQLEALEQKGVKAKNMAVWMGSGPYNSSYIEYLNERRIPVLAWPKEGARRSALGPATIAVTDYALQKKPIEGLSRADKSDYENCISN